MEKLGKLNISVNRFQVIVTNAISSIGFILSIARSEAVLDMNVEFHVATNAVFSNKSLNDLYHQYRWRTRLRLEDLLRSHTDVTSWHWKSSERENQSGTHKSDENENHTKRLNQLRRHKIYTQCRPTIERKS